MRIYSRGEWDAQPPKRPLSAIDDPRGAAIHWNGPPRYYEWTEPGEAAEVRAIQQYHMWDRNPPFIDIGYSFVVAQSGRIWEGRGWGHKPAAQGAGNSEAHAYYWMGGAGQSPTDEAKAAMAWLVEQTPSVTGTREFVRPHSYWMSTTCPGDEWRTMIDAEWWENYVMQFTDEEVAKLRHLLTEHEGRFILGEHVDEVIAQGSSGKGVVTATVSMWRQRPWEDGDAAVTEAWSVALEGHGHGDLPEHTHPDVPHSHTGTITVT